MDAFLDLDLGLGNDPNTFTEWEREEIKNGVAYDMMVGNLWFLPLQTSHAGDWRGAPKTLNKVTGEQFVGCHVGVMDVPMGS